MRQHKKAQWLQTNFMRLLGSFMRLAVRMLKGKYALLLNLLQERIKYCTAQTACANNCAPL